MSKKKDVDLETVGTPITQDKGKRKLDIEAKVTTNALYLRMDLATADLPDGTEVEVTAALTGGSFLITISKAPGMDGWVTYELTPDAVVSAVLASEEERKREEKAQDE